MLLGLIAGSLEMCLVRTKLRWVGGRQWMPLSRGSLHQRAVAQANGRRAVGQRWIGRREVLVPYGDEMRKG